MWSFVLVILGLVLPGPAAAAPKADLWPYWERHDPRSAQTVDHTPWAAFLERYVRVGDDGVNRVGYREVTDEDRAALARYIGALEGLLIRSYARAEQMAYWINLYNALTVRVILDHYPVETIRDVDISGFFADGPWGAELLTIEGQDVSLDDIEHRILRPIWRDPRIHYAVNCASIGCPDLRAEPYLASALERQLEAAARDYVNDPRGVLIEDGELIVSSIYGWFEEDFGGSEQGVIQHLRRHAGQELKARLSSFTSIDDDRYDWSLNDAR